MSRSFDSAQLVGDWILHSPNARALEKLELKATLLLIENKFRKLFKKKKK